MNLLITGSSGLIGSELIKHILKEKKYNLSILTRNKKSFKYPNQSIKVYEWDIENQTIDEEAIQNADAIIHLAGAGVADGRWTQKRKKNISESRIKGTQLLTLTIKKLNASVKIFISANAIGIYGNTQDTLIDEGFQASSPNFLSNVCKNWEQQSLNHNLPLRSVVLRIGIVLSKNGGALKKMLLPFYLGLGGKLGSGQQYMSWIHITDLTRMFLYVLENHNITGSINAVSPNPVTNMEFTKTLGKIIKRPTIFSVPSLVLKAVFGEMSSILLEGQNVSSKKIKSLGFSFQHPHLENSLKDILD